MIAAVEPALEDGVGTALFDGAICGGAREGLETDFAADHFPDGVHFREDFVAADFDLGVGEDGHGSRWMQLCIATIHHNRDEAIDFPSLTTIGYYFVAHPLLAVFQIRRQHRHQEVVEMLTACFKGLLGTDRGK